ncbi:MAG: cell division protein ZapA [Pseudobdellovibrio sp.]
MNTETVNEAKVEALDKAENLKTLDAQLKKTFDFRIAGVSYKIKSSHDEQTIQQLVQYVNSKVMEAMKITKNSSFQNAAVLASLNIAEEMLLLKRKAQNELDKLESKAIKLVNEIENTKTNKTF